MTLPRYRQAYEKVLGNVWTCAVVDPHGEWVRFTDAQAAIAEAEARGYARGVEDAARFVDALKWEMVSTETVAHVIRTRLERTANVAQKGTKE